MGSDSDSGAPPSRRSGGPGRRADDGTARPSTEGPPTVGEVAARRLIVGHLDTSDLDPVTAKAVELLAAADMVAAERFSPKPPRLWREPMWLVTIFVMVVLVLLSATMLLLLQRSDERGKQSERLTQISEQIKSCVDPAGACTKRGQEQTGAAVEMLNRTTVAVVECADTYDGKAAIDACVLRQLAKARG